MGDQIIKKYMSPPSVLKIKEVSKPDCQFNFSNVNVEKIRNDIKGLNTKKASIEDDIPTKILVGSVEVVSDYLADIYNNAKNK